MSSDSRDGVARLDFEDSRKGRAPHEEGAHDDERNSEDEMDPTTLLLVGIVVLLERRIVDNAVRKFRNAAEEARARMRDDFRIEVQDFTDRVNAEWAAASPEDVDAMKERTKRLSKELADNYVEETLEA